MGGQAGDLPGRAALGPLAAIYVAVGVGQLRLRRGRLCSTDTLGAMIGVTVAAVVPARGWRLRTAAPEPPGPPFQRAGGTRPAPGRRGAARDGAQLARPAGVLRAVQRRRGHARGSRSTTHQAGLDAGGLILTKAVLFLPSSSSCWRSRRWPRRPRASTWQKNLLLGFGLGLVAVAGRLRSSAASRAVRGRHRGRRSATGCGPSPTSGRCWAMLQVMVYDVLARQHRRRCSSSGRPWSSCCAVPFVRAAREWLVVVLVTDATAAAGPPPAEPAGRGGRRGDASPSTRLTARQRGLSGAASCQLAPEPTDTSSGTVSSAAAPIARAPAPRAPAPPPARPRGPARRAPGAASGTCSPASRERGVDLEHRDLDDVGGGPLDRCVEGHPLGHLAALAVVAGQVGEVAAPAEDRLGVAGAPGLVDDPAEVVADAAEPSRSTRPSALAPRRRRSAAAGTARRPRGRRRGRSSSP